VAKAVIAFVMLTQNEIACRITDFTVTHTVIDVLSTNRTDTDILLVFVHSILSALATC
jgi:hypothetical protein